MKTQTINQDNLIREFYKEYESKNGKFLLFDLANANENANTKVLKHLIQYDKHKFLTSFLERTGLPMPNGQVYITDQEKAIGNKDTGFIDLYIKYNDIHIIIENKIYGAGDTEKQLARYIATVNGIKNGDFEEWYSNPKVDKETHVVYLTADGTKEPTGDSLPFSLKDKINYYAISYKDDILPWLEEDVLPNLPYGADGIMIYGVQQYIAFMRQLLADESSAVVDKYVSSLQGTDVEKYSQLLSATDGYHNSTPENVLKSLRKQLGVRAEAIFSADVEDKWVLHFTPSYINLYKKSWMALDTRKYSIPTLFIFGGNTQAFLKNGCLNKLVLGVTHLAPAVKSSYPQYEHLFGNHDRNIGITLLDNPGDITCADINNPGERKAFYKSVIAKIEPIISKIDKGVEELRNSGNPITPNDVLRMVLNACSNLV